MTDQIYRVKSGPLYLVRFHEDGTGTKAIPEKNGLPATPAVPGKPNLTYQPVFSRNIADALVFTDSEEAGAAAQLVQQHGKDASLDPEPPKAAPSTATVAPTPAPEPAPEVHPAETTSP